MPGAEVTAGPLGEEVRDVNVTYCVDVGSVAGGNFAWARRTDDVRGAGAEHELGGTAVAR